MLDLQAVLISNGVGVTLMIVLLISNRLNARHVFFDEKIFCAMASLTLALCLLETGTFFLDGRTFFLAKPLNRITNTLLFVADVFFAFIWTVYVDFKLFENLDHVRKSIRLTVWPGAIIVLLGLANLFTDVFFTISPDNVYQRTPLVVIAYIVTYGYLIYSAVLVFTTRRKLRRYLFLPVIIFLVPIFIGSILQFLFYGLSLIWVSVAVGVVSLYINIQNEASSVDLVTGLYNRQYLRRYLSSITSRLGQGVRLAGLLLDIDDFKEINDTHGHVVGDAALRDVGQLLHSTVPADAFAARFAGDEFIVLRAVTKEEEVLNMMDSIRFATEAFNREQQRPYQLSFSMGFSYFQAGDTAETFLRRMDEAMYQDKRSKIPERI